MIAAVPFAVLRDDDRRVSSSYGVRMFPETYLIDKDGAALMYIISNRDWMSPAAKA